MRLSIIIPCFNEVNTLEALLDAVWAAPYADKEIIVIDVVDPNPQIDVFSVK